MEAEAHDAPRVQAPPLSVGAVVGERYRIVKEIGGGGMGFVFEAEHIALERRFALKVLRIGHWDEELVRRFEREARALGKISSPRVAQVSDFGVADGIGPYYVMELVPGQSLQERLDESPMAPRDAVETAICLCDAVVDVHSQGIVHRDLKPANIGLPGGAIPVKLLDFGLAASIDDAFFTRITQSQQVLGSMPYISPEQFAGARPSVPQDVWAIGVVFHEMLTGTLPFEAPSTPALMHRILTAPPALRGEVPKALAEALDALLHKDPEQRVRTASEAAQLLRGIDVEALPDKLEISNARELGNAATGLGSGVRLSTGGMSAPSLPSNRPNYLKAALGILVVSVLIALGAVWVSGMGDGEVDVAVVAPTEAVEAVEAVEAPVVETPVVETPMVETPVETPAVEAPAETQVAEAPTMRTGRRVNMRSTMATVSMDVTMDEPATAMNPAAMDPATETNAATEMTATMNPAETNAATMMTGAWTGEIIE